MEPRLGWADMYILEVIRGSAQNRKPENTKKHHQHNEVSTNQTTETRMIFSSVLSRELFLKKMIIVPLVNAAKANDIKYHIWRNY